MNEKLPFRLGYATSGFAHHRLEDAMRLLASYGYRAVSLTLDVQHLDPFAPDLPGRTAKLRRLLEELDLAVVVETGARYLLDPARKHQPTLLSDEADGRRRRAEFLATSVSVARDLGADGLSFWSGAAPPGLDDSEAWDRLVRGTSALIEDAAAKGVRLGFEPEPGMFVATAEQWTELDRRLGSPPGFGLAFDVGHALATEEGDPAELLRRHAGRLTTVAVEDMRRRLHEHVMFGEGHLDLPGVVDALEAIRYAGVVSVELPRHAHAATTIAARCAEIFAALGADVRPR